MINDLRKLIIQLIKRGVTKERDLIHLVAPYSVLDLANELNEMLAEGLLIDKVNELGIKRIYFQNPENKKQNFLNC